MDARRYVFLCLVALSFDMLAACTPKDVGYVEIKTVPVATPTTTLYLDSLKFEPPKNGSAVLRQQVGTAKLSAQASGGQMAVTTVTISLLERPPRCQCRNTAVSEPSAVRSCIG
jgi:hypothetical protein